MSLIYEVSIRENPVVLTESVGREPNRIDVNVSDSVSVYDRVVNPAEIFITRITPGRARSGDTLTITGGGFNPTASRNVVSFSYQNVSPLTATETKLTVVAQSSMDFNRDQFFDVKVTNLATNRYATRKIWSQRTVETILTTQPRAVYPAKAHTLATSGDAQVAEARDWANLMSLIRFMQGDVEAGKRAGVKSTDGYGPSIVKACNPLSANTSAGFYGQSLKTDQSQLEHVAYGYLQDETICFGGILTETDTTAMNLALNGKHTTSVGSGSTAGTTHGVLGKGTADLAWLLVSRDTGTDTLDRVRVLVDGAAVYDSGSGLGLPAGSGNARAVFRAELSLPVVRPNRLQIEVTKSGTGSNISLVGGLRMLID